MVKATETKTKIFIKPDGSRLQLVWLADVHGALLMQFAYNIFCNLFTIVFISTYFPGSSDRLCDYLCLKAEAVHIFLTVPVDGDFKMLPILQPCMYIPISVVKFSTHEVQRLESLNT